MKQMHCCLAESPGLAIRASKVARMANQDLLASKISTIAEVSNLEEKNTALEKQLGVFDGWAIGSGAMIGVTIFVTSGLMVGIAGPAASVSFFVGALITLVIALCFCELSSAFPYAGGVYAYPRETLGDSGKFVSFVVGWSFYGGQGLGPAIVGLSFAYYFNWFLEIIGVTTLLPDTTIAILIIIIFGICNLIGTSFGKGVQNWTTILVAGSLLIFIGIGLFRMDPANLEPFAPMGFKGMLSATAIGWMAYGGWSTIPNMASEFRNPGRDVPISMLSSIITCGVFFSLIVLTMSGLHPYQELAKEAAPVAVAAMKATKYGGFLIAAAGIFASASTLNGLMMTGSRVLYSMGKAGDLPPAFASVHPKFGTPSVAILVTMAGQVILAWTGLLFLLVEMIVFVTSIAWAITCLCVFGLRRNRPEIQPKIKTPLYPVTPILAVILSAFLCRQLSSKALLVGTIWIGIGIAIYLINHYVIGTERLADTPAK